MKKLNNNKHKHRNRNKHKYTQKYYQRGGYWSLSSGGQSWTDWFTDLGARAKNATRSLLNRVDSFIPSFSGSAYSQATSSSSLPYQPIAGYSPTPPVVPSTVPLAPISATAPAPAPAMPTPAPMTSLPTAQIVSTAPAGQINKPTLKLPDNDMNYDSVDDDGDDDKDKTALFEEDKDKDKNILDLKPKPLPPPIGGRRRRKSLKKQRGGKGLGLTYYATPITGIKTAQPTYELLYNNGVNQTRIKGGRRRKKRGTTTRKRHSHRHSHSHRRKH